MTRLYSNEVQKLHQKFRAREAKAIDAYDTARAFINDGAYDSGARYLRVAASHFEASQAAKNAAFAAMTSEAL